MTVTNRNRDQAHWLADMSWDQFTGRPATAVAPDLVGCRLVRRLPSGETLRGLIVETEAYCPNDPACHAHRGKTPSNAAMFGSPGQSYVYFIYGMYHCLNVVTDRIEIGSAVLIRALDLESLPSQIDPKQALKPKRIAAGPGKLCRALAIDRSHNGKPFIPTNNLWIEPRLEALKADLMTGRQTLTQTTRIGISKAKDLPWRWYLTGNEAVSKL